MNKLQQTYNDKIKQALHDELKLSNKMQVPSFAKISLNMGVGEAMNDRKVLDRAVEDMRLISGQSPVITKARNSIAGFKLREDYPIGCKVTLRRANMWNFLDKIINVCIPRIRDFRGMSAKSFDQHGNYSFGIKEQIIFPEIEFDKVDKIRGMDIVLCINAVDRSHGLSLLKAIGFPFEK